MPRKKHRVKTHETGSRRAPAHPAPSIPRPVRSTDRGPRAGTLSPLLRAALVTSLLLVAGAAFSVLLDASEAAAAARCGHPAEPKIVMHHALRLDGASALRLPPRVLAPDSATAPFTVECWVRGASPSGDQTVLGSRHYGGVGLTWSIASLGLDRPTAWVNMSRVPGTGRKGYLLLRPPLPWATSRWTHLALVHADGIVRLFVDGTLSAESVVGGRIAWSDASLYIGADPTGTGDPEQFFTGEIDDVRISTVARYTGPFVPPARHEPDAGTALLLDFEDDAQPFRDLSTGRHVAESVGRPRVVTTTR